MFSISFIYENKHTWALRLPTEKQNNTIQNILLYTTKAKRYVDYIFQWKYFSQVKAAPHRAKFLALPL